MPNFTLLDMHHPEVTKLVAAMLQARDAVGRRSWSHPAEPVTEEWWADVLSDPRARRRERRDRSSSRSQYTLADESRAVVLVACEKCDWRAAFSRRELIEAHGAGVIRQAASYLGDRGGSTGGPTRQVVGPLALIDRAMLRILSHGEGDKHQRDDQQGEDGEGQYHDLRGDVRHDDHACLQEHSLPPIFGPKDDGSFVVVFITDLGRGARVLRSYRRFRRVRHRTPVRAFCHGCGGTTIHGIFCFSLTRLDGRPFPLEADVCCPQAQDRARRLFGWR
jgi:hypothetical protein